jgi:hypothetical protein
METTGDTVSVPAKSQLRGISAFQSTLTGVPHHARDRATLLGYAWGALPSAARYTVCS